MNPRRQTLTVEHARDLTRPTQPWLSCEACFDLMDAYAEALLGEPATTAEPEMLVHLHACGACAEETETLVLQLAEDDGLDPAPALARLHPQV